MRRWVVVFAGGLLIAGLGVFLAVQNLDKADTWSSVFGLFVGLAGLGVAVSAVVGGRRQSGGQSERRSWTAGPVRQVDGVDGDVELDR